MKPSTLAWTAFWSLVPISELRGAIPFAVSQGMGILPAFLFCTAVNALVAPIAYLFLSSVHALLYRWKFYASLFDRFVARARAKLHAGVEKYGYLGIFIFVAIPAPLTGAWTGTLGGWVLGMKPWKVMLAVACGVLAAGVIVSLVVAFGVEALSFLLKRI